jgi:hypothetical protein
MEPDDDDNGEPDDDPERDELAAFEQIDCAVCLAPLSVVGVSLKHDTLGYLCSGCA